MPAPSNIASYEQDSYPNIRILVTFESELLRSTMAELAILHPTLQIHYRKQEAINDLIHEVGMVMVEVRVVEGFQDLNYIGHIRSLRPMMPIIALSYIDSEEFSLMIFDRGANEVVAIEISAALLSRKITSLAMYADAAHLIECKNNEVVDTLVDLRVTKTDLKDQTLARQLAEQRHMAAEIQIKHFKQVQDIMDSFYDGFLYVEQDCLIGKTISAKSSEIFGSDIVGKPIREVLKLEDNKGGFIEFCAMQIFDDILPLAASLSMLPHQVKTLTGLILNIDYRVIRDSTQKVDKIIFICRDVTKEVEVEKQNLERANVNKCLISILKSKDQFLMFLEDFRSDMDSLKSNIDINAILKILHTIKGTSGAFGLERLANLTHNLETQVIGLPASDAQNHIPKFAEQLATVMREFLESHYAVLAINYSQSSLNHYSIDDQVIQNFESIASSAPADISVQLRDLICQLTHKPISLLINTYVESVKQLSRKLKKEVKFTILGDAIRIDIERCSAVFRSLVHALNNAVDHGIEDLPTRAIRGKPKVGTLILEFCKDDANNLIIKITDDGGGIDRRNLARIAIEKGILSAEQLRVLTDQDIDMLIFNDNLSSRSSVSATSGRGIGMSALKESVEILGGKIIVESTPQKSTALKIVIPPYGVHTNRRRSVLIVDDEESIRHLYRDILEDQGVDIQESNNGIDALLALSKRNFDLVITDLPMPGFSGIELIKKIREVRRSLVPILVVSGLPELFSIDELRNLESVWVLEKGAQIAEMVTLIESILSPINIEAKNPSCNLTGN